MLLSTIVLLLALAQAIVPGLLFADGFTESVRQPPLRIEPTPATPAGYAFAIWGVIYLGAVASAVYQLRNPVDARVAALSAVGYALGIGWLVAARYGPLWATVPIIWAMLLTLGAAFLIAASQTAGRTDASWYQSLVVAPLAIYVGWLTAAAWINTADVLPGYGIVRLGLDADTAGSLVIGAAGALALAVIGLVGVQWAYVATVLWALVAIVVRNGPPSLAEPVSLAATVAAAVLLAVAAAGAART